MSGVYYFSYENKEHDLKCRKKEVEEKGLWC